MATLQRNSGGGDGAAGNGHEPPRRNAPAAPTSAARYRPPAPGSAACRPAQADSADSQLRGPVAARLAGVRVQQAASSMSLADHTAANAYLDAAVQACEEVAGAAYEQAFPLEAAEIAYCRALLLAATAEQGGTSDRWPQVWGACSPAADELLMAPPKQAAAKAGMGARARRGTRRAPPVALAEGACLRQMHPTPFQVGPNHC
jgi:hypothetical protein